MRHILRIITVIFLGNGLWLLLRRVDLTYQFVPLATPGPEGGMNEIAMDIIHGGGATILGSIFAAILYFRTRPSKVGAVLLAWGCLQLIGFIIFWIHDFVS